VTESPQKPTGLSHLQAWRLLPEQLSAVVWYEVEAAMKLAGVVCTQQSMSEILIRLIGEARRGDTGPMQGEHRRRLRVLVWRWCAHTASEGL
jgi:hypothetical protein